MSDKNVWGPVLAALVNAGYSLPEQVTIEVAGNVIVVQVPDELVAKSDG